MFIVTLSGSEHFEGFLIQARDATNPDGLAIGSFTLIDPQISQRLTCNSIEVCIIKATFDINLDITYKLQFKIVALSRIILLGKDA